MDLSALVVVILKLLAIACLATAVAPWLRLKYWWVRIRDFPRPQQAVLAAAIAAALFGLAPPGPPVFMRGTIVSSILIAAKANHCEFRAFSHVTHACLVASSARSFPEVVRSRSAWCRSRRNPPPDTCPDRPTSRAPSGHAASLPMSIKMRLGLSAAARLTPCSPSAAIKTSKPRRCKRRESMSRFISLSST